jgi:hypothetical protein
MTVITIDGDGGDIYDSGSNVRTTMTIFYEDAEENRECQLC